MKRKRSRWARKTKETWNLSGVPKESSVQVVQKEQEFSERRNKWWGPRLEKKKKKNANPCARNASLMKRTLIPYRQPFDPVRLFPDHPSLLQFLDGF